MILGFNKLRTKSKKMYIPILEQQVFVTLQQTLIEKLQIMLFHTALIS